MPKSSRTNITMDELQGYLDEALSDSASAKVEKALRESTPLRHALSRIMKERDRGEHSIGGMWRRHRLTCLSREQLGAYVLKVQDADLADYIHFHLETIGCAYCQANLADLQSQTKEPTKEAKARRQKYYDSSRGYLTK